MFGLTTRSKDPWPLKFRRHNFDAYCYNTQNCSLVYDGFQFSLHVNDPSPPPPQGNYRARWCGTNIIGEKFGTPVRIDWASLDGVDHHAKVDLAGLFEDRLVRHYVAKEDIPEGWLAAWGVEPLGVDILMEVNDCTVSVYMRAHITTKDPQESENSRSCHRRDLIQVWTHTY